MELLIKVKEVLKKMSVRKGFEKIAKEWVELKRPTVKESTYYKYLFIIEKYLNPEFHKKKMSQINYSEYIQKISETLATSTVTNIANVFRAILNYYENEYDCELQEKNMKLPAKQKPKLSILKKREIRKLEEYCLSKNTLKTLGIIVCLNTGVRIGEICSLKWKNIDVEERKIYIDETLQRVYDKKSKKTEVIVDKAKTQTSMRNIPMNKKLYELLKPLKKKYKDEDYFLTGSDKKVVEPRNYQYSFKKILKECKIKPYKFHILRHTFATNCVEIGMDVKSLSEILGHSDVNVTLKFYVHSTDKMKKKYLEKL